MTFKKFNDAFLKAVDFTFSSLGESCKQALYFHLKTTFHLDRAEIPEKVGEFDNVIRLIFKDGAVFLENLILEKLCDSLGVEFEENDALGFVEAISKVRNMVSERESLLAVSDFSEEVAAVKRERGG
jgi:hypothetical protein